MHSTGDHSADLLAVSLKPFVGCLRTSLKDSMEALGELKDSHSSLGSPGSLSYAGTEKEGYYRPHLVSNHHGGNASCACLDSAFPRGVAFWLLVTPSRLSVTFYFLKT